MDKEICSDSSFGENAYKAPNKHREIWIDFGRVFAIFLIVAYHLGVAEHLIRPIVQGCLFYFLFFVGFFCRKENLIYRLKYCLISYTTWGLLSALLQEHFLYEATTYRSIGGIVFAADHVWHITNKYFTNNWVWWFLRDMLIFYMFMAGVYLVFGSKKIFPGSLILTIVILIAGFSTFKNDSHYLLVPFIGFAMRKAASISDIKYIVKKTWIACLLGILPVMIYSKIQYEPFVSLFFAGIAAIAFMGCCIFTSTYFPKMAFFVSKGAWAVFFIFISHIILALNNFYVLHFCWKLSGYYALINFFNALAIVLIAILIIHIIYKISPRLGMVLNLGMKRKT